MMLMVVSLEISSRFHEKDLSFADDHAVTFR
jgi:hypothetical protein